jgi:hypothetical protein
MKYPPHTASSGSSPEPAIARDGQAPLAAPPGASSDAPSSNRASEKCSKDPTFQVIWQGEDFLEVSFPGTVRREAAAQLAKLKTLAQSREVGDQAQAQIALGGSVFSVHDRGGGRLFPSVVSNACFYLKFADGCASKIPAAFGQVRSDYLFRVGASRALQELRRMVEELADLGGGETVSRIDLTADFTVDADIERFPRKAWVNRGSNSTAYAVGDQFSGLSFGLGGDISSRLYDKQLEIRTQSRKVQLFDVWLKNGWNPLCTPWRLEFQLRRPALQRFGLRSLEDVLRARETLWQYLTGEWLRLVTPSDSDSTRSRWATVPFWLDIGNLSWASEAVPLTPSGRLNAAPQDKWIARQFWSVLSSAMAKAGITSLDEGMAHLVRMSRNQWEEKAEWEGAPVELLLEEAVRAKGRKFGTMLNTVRMREPGEDDELRESARAYKRASRGA